MRLGRHRARTFPAMWAVRVRTTKAQFACRGCVDELWFVKQHFFVSHKATEPASTAGRRLFLWVIVGAFSRAARTVGWQSILQATSCKLGVRLAQTAILTDYQVCCSRLDISQRARTMIHISCRLSSVRRQRD